jgi:RNA polymerase sigma-70 factor (ECF subfamily)
LSFISYAPYCDATGVDLVITLEADGEFSTTALEIKDGTVAAIYVVRNPDKLRHLH